MEEATRPLSEGNRNLEASGDSVSFFSSLSLEDGTDTSFFPPSLAIAFPPSVRRKFGGRGDVSMRMERKRKDTVGKKTKGRVPFIGERSASFVFAERTLSLS